MAARFSPLLDEGCLRPFAERLVDAAGVRPGDTVLDAPSDSGVLAAVAARVVGPRGRLVAADPDPAAVDATSERLAVAGLGARCTVARTDPAGAARRGPVDVALALFTAPFLDDPGAALAAVRAALRPGGRVVWAVWARGAAPHLEAVARALDDAGLRSRFLVRLLSLGDDAAVRRLRDDGTEVSVERVRDVVRFDGAAHHWAALGGEGALADELAAVDGATLAAVRRSCERRLAVHRSWDGTLRIPAEALLLRAAA